MIPLLSQLVQLISIPPGDLVYHLIVLFAIEAILMMAIGEGRRANWQSGTVQVALAAGGLLIGRCMLVIVALLSAADIVNPAWVAPPLERLVAVVSLGLLAWAFLPLMDDYPQAGLVLVVVNLVGGAVLYAVFAPQWYTESQLAGASFNATLADGVWNIWAVALASLALIAVLVRRRAQWGMFLAALGLLLLGHLMHLFMVEAQAHVAGWVRLAELCAYPILAGLMVSRAVEREESTSAAATAPWTVIEMCQRVADASNMNVALQRASVAISNVLGADTLAIGMLNEAGDTVELAAVYRAGSPPRSGPTFDLASQPPVQSAVSRQHTVSVDSDQEAQRVTLAALVGGTTGSLWVQPLIYQRTTVGVLIVSRPHMASGWTMSETQTLNGLCSVLSAALLAAYKTAALARQVDELRLHAHSQETALAQAQAEAQRWSTQLMQERARAQAAVRGKATRPVEASPSGSSPAPPTEPPVADVSSPRGLFFTEAARRLQQLDDTRGRLAISPNDPDVLAELVRAAQSLKEASAPMGYNTLARLAGALADALQHVKDGQQPVTPNLLALVGESASALRTLSADAQANRSPGVDISSLLSRLTSSPLTRPPRGQVR